MPPTQKSEYPEKENLLTGTKLTLTYDERGQLIRAILPGGQTIQYSIDGEGKRLAKTVDGVLSSVYLHDVQGRLVAELEPSGNIKSRFIYATQAHSPDYMIRDGVNYFFAKDQLGSVRAVVDSNSGNVLQLIQYDEFGRVLADTNPGFQPFGFAGGHYDHQTGLVRFGARDYDPEIGRWLSKDPILFKGRQVNLYSYVGQEPVNKIDPKGKLCVIVRSLSHLIGFFHIINKTDNYAKTCQNRPSDAEIDLLKRWSTGDPAQFIWDAVDSCSERIPMDRFPSPT